MARKYLRGASGSTRGTVTFDSTAAFWNEGNEIYTNDDECLESLSELEIHIV